MSADGKILFKLTPTSLIVANTGVPFSLHGLIAIIYGSTSTKNGERHSWPEDDRQFHDEDEAKNVITERREAKQSHLADRYELNSQSSQQIQTVQSYAGRVLVELLQNAVDAGQENPIGYKGVGFRSVLNITDHPEIHSVHLHVCWSPDIARATIGEAAANLPVLAFPQWCPNRDEVADGYTTTVVLPLSPEKRGEIQDEWDRIVSDPSLVVFIEGVSELIWDAGSARTIWRRGAHGNRVTVEQTVGSNAPETLRWHIHKSGEAAVATPIDVSGRLRVSAAPVATGLRCFFPTEDTNPFTNVLIHARFDLATDRKHIDTESSAAKERIAEVVNDIASAMVSAAAARTSIGEALDVLAADTSTEKIQTRLREAVKAAVMAQPTMTPDGLSLSSLRSCPRVPDEFPYGFRDSDKRLQLWEQFKASVARHRPGGLGGLPLLPLASENITREKTLLWINPTAALTKKELSDLPWAKAVDEPEPCDSRVLFALPRGEAAVVFSIPQGIALHFLDSDFQRDVIERLGQNAGASFLTHTLGVREFQIAHVIERSVLGALQSEDQPEGTVEFLFALWSRAEKKERGDFDWTVPWRERLIRQCKVCCRDGGQRPALDVYAGSDWTGSDYLECCYGPRGDGTFLHPPPAGEEEHKQWADFYRWLGVGWAPKVLPLVLEKGTRRGWQWTEGRFVTEGPEPPGWRDYCAWAWARSYRGSAFTYRTPRLKQDWKLDGGEEVVEHPGAFEAISAAWPYYARYVESVGSWSSRQGQEYGHDNDNEHKTAVSYFIWRLRRLRWLPAVKTELRQRPVDLFRSGAVASSQALSGWVFSIGSDFPDKVADALDLRREWEQVTLDDWRRWLAAAENLKPQEPSDDREAIRLLYKCLLANAELDDEKTPFKSSKLWWVERLPERDVWRLAKVNQANGAYLDRPEHEPLRLPGIVVFPARLDDKAAKAESLFGMPRLSQRLTGIPQPSGEWTMREMTERISNRAPYLVAYLGKNEQRQQEIRTTLETVKVTGATRLSVTWKLDGAPRAERDHASFAHKDDGCWRLYLRASVPPASADPAWERLAEVILLACGRSSTERASDVKDLLIYEESFLIEKLTNLGVAPETVADAQRTALESRQRLVIDPPPTNAGTSTLASDPPAKPFVDAWRGAAVNPPPAPPGGGTVPPPLQPPGGTQRPHPETGLPAQEWLRSKLTEALARTQWHVSDAEVTIEDGGSRIDIRLQPSQGEPLYIEAKHTTGSTIYWSALQIDTARRNSGRYFVALLRGTSPDDYEVRWVFDPLVQFADLSRSVNWTWRVHPGAGGIDPQWQPTETPPALPADGFKAVITILPAFRAQLPFGIEALVRVVAGAGLEPATSSA